MGSRGKARTAAREKLIAEILERTRKAREEIGKFIADEVASPHIAGMSLQDIARVEIRPELYDQLLVYAIDRGRSINAIVEEILVKDLPEVTLEVAVDTAPLGAMLMSAAERGLPITRIEGANFVNTEQPATESGGRRILCVHGGTCPRPFHWRQTTRCGCARAP